MAIPEVEWHQDSKQMTAYGHLAWVLVGMARNPDTKERIGPVYIAPLGTEATGYYPPGSGWIPIKDSQENAYLELTTLQLA